MKTQKQCEDRLDKTVGELERLAGQCKEGEELSHEKQIELCVVVASLVILAWVMDCEEEMKPLVRAFRLAAVAKQLEAQKP